MFVHLNFGKEFASNQLVIAEPDIATGETEKSELKQLAAQI